MDHVVDAVTSTINACYAIIDCVLIPVDTILLFPSC